MPERISFRGPASITIVPVLEELELYRVVHVDRPHHPWLATELTSNYERGARPRRIERVFSVVHMAISTFTTAQAARALALRYPDIGTHLARLQLPGGAGFCIDQPPGGAHRSLWGAPLQLAACVIDVEPV